ncbi:sensor histidine kinase [Roseimaritima ulvae]|uniref:Sensor histidine kinase LiaS n=1 Tax=Roseimaritima ulvae TaxID=980254 RepID=A0A5B9QY54_9BACT|nr:ATP-binding protein [Roseimaritima ulvae]QEG42770.1 Sensor histidine kinase LiaS [Roseimaritima ulvae]
MLERQQQHFSHELHDVLMPLLFAARMQAERLRDSSVDESLRDELTTLAGYLGEASTEARRLIVETHPPELQHTTWHAALQHYVERGLPAHDVPIEFHLAKATASVPDDVATALYRIAQEAIRNALRHAQPQHLRVIAQGGPPDAVSLRIEDDGCGFSTRDVDSNRFGLRNIQARSQAAGGTARIDSTPGQGTTIEVTI